MAANRIDRGKNIISSRIFITFFILVFLIIHNLRFLRSVCLRR